MARTGRPQSDNPLKYDIKVRLDEETFSRLNAICEETGIERATFIREAVIARMNGEIAPIEKKAKEAPKAKKAKTTKPAAGKAKAETKTAKSSAAPAAPSAEKPAAEITESREAAKPKKNLDVFLL